MEDEPQRIVGILLFDDVEVLDFAGPFEVFAVTDEFAEPESKPFRVVTLSRQGQMVRAKNGLRVKPDFSINEHPKLDIIVVPGGEGSRAAMNDLAILDFVKRHHAKGIWILSVCTGALILGKAGLLSGLTAITHHTALKELKKTAPDITIDKQARFVDHLDDHGVITAGGISAGIDMSLYVVDKILGPQAALETMQEMEYQPQIGNPPKTAH